MPKSFDQPLPLMEVERLNRPGDSAPGSVKPLNRLPEKTLQQAKAQFGAALKVARGPMPMRAIGTEALVSRVESGPGVPDYIGRLIQDDAARVRLGLELIRPDMKVRKRLDLPGVSIEVDEGIG